ncbi:MAG: Fe-S biogenesis protein NfuA [Arsenophonus endosymbiont of Ceratovacuna japonica]
MINITKAAQIHFTKLLLNQDIGTQIRIFVINPGTTYAECGVSYCSIDTIENIDIEIKFKKFSVYIDKTSAPFLKDAKIDFIKDNLESQLILKAPNIKIQKNSNNSPLIERIKYVIQSKINPQLSNHGGLVTLIEITNDKYAILQFSGGCNGCSMINFTLKNNIEKQLLNMFPDELKGVKDLTEHKRGTHSFY